MKVTKYINFADGDEYDIYADPVKFINNVTFDESTIFNGDLTLASGSLSINGTTLVVDSVNNRVGINKSPSVALDISGATSMTGNLTVATNKFFVNSSTGQIGIGTASPSYAIHLTTSTAQGTTPDLFLGNTNGYLSYYPNAGATNNNPAVAAGDKTLIFSNASINTGSLFIGPYSNTSGGLGIKFTSSGVNLYGPTALSATGTSAFSINTNLFLVDATNSRVGIGVTPLDTLHISGNIRLDSSSNKIYLFYSSGSNNLYIASTNESTTPKFFIHGSGTGGNDISNFSVEPISGIVTLKSVSMNGSAIDGNTSNIMYLKAGSTDALTISYASPETKVKVNQNLVIPTSAPTNPENGSIWLT